MTQSAKIISSHSCCVDGRLRGVRLCADEMRLRFVDNEGLLRRSGGTDGRRRSRPSRRQLEDSQEQGWQAAQTIAAHQGK